MILVVLIVIMLVAPKGGSNPTVNPSNPPENTSSGKASSGKENVVKTNSSQARNISLGAGNASHSYQPY